MGEVFHIGEPRFRFSLVSAVYNVSAFLPEFFASLEAQTFGLENIEVILVDDGSTDASPGMLREWAAENPTVRVITKSNGGQAEARNRGLAEAVGEWVTFVDPDDWVDPGYFASVDQFIAAHPSVEMVATNRVLVNQVPGQPDVQARHPLARMFDGGDRLIDLDQESTFFHGSAPATFVRLDRVRAIDLMFDVRLRPNFEDGHFCASYVLRVPRPRVGFLRSAKYFYRKRGDNTSTLQTGRNHPGRYAEVPRFGFLGALEDAARLHGSAPVWLQNLIIYELSWYFGLDEGVVIPSPSEAEARDYFLDSLRSIRRYLDPETIDSFDIRPLKVAWRHILIYGLCDEDWCSGYAVLQRLDPSNRLARITYQFVGRRPEEHIRINGEHVVPAHSKYRAVIYFGATLLWERTVWLPRSGTIEILADGRPLEIRTSWDGVKRRFIAPAQIASAMKLPKVARKGPPLKAGLAAPKPLRHWLRQSFRRPTWLKRPAWLKRASEMKKMSPGQRKVAARESLAVGVLRRRSETAARYENAIVLMDRVHNANDSAEHLFAYLRTERPEVNAWFVIEKKAKDYKRLRSAWGDRVVAYRSFTWYLLILSCRWIASTHADGVVINPAGIAALRSEPFNFAFLQHGVIKDDLSNWLNQRRIDFMVSSTPGEHESLVGDGTAYTLTTKEVRLTGLPRFDRLQAARDAVGDGDRRLVILAPTWRQWLQAPPDVLNSQRRVIDDSFQDSEFFRRWSELVQSPRLHRLIDEHGLELCLLPHPNLDGMERYLDPSLRFRVLSFDGADIYREFARCHTLITDYSSSAFNAAFLERSVIYYQFDADRMFGGDHVGRGGYFKYDTAGFGPVVQDLEGVIAAVDTIAANGGKPVAPFDARIEEAFPIRDGRCCERTADGILEML